MLYQSSEYRSYIDSRFAEVYPAEHFHRYMDIKAQPFLFDEEAKKWGIDVVAMSYEAALSKPIVQYLTTKPDWKAVYMDAFAIIFVRSDKANAILGGTAAVDHWKRLNEIETERLTQSKFGNFNLRWHSDQARGLINVSGANLMLGNISLAKENLRTAEAFDATYPDLLSSRCRLGFVQVSRAYSQAPTPSKANGGPSPLGTDTEALEKRNLLDNTETVCLAALKESRGFDTTSVQVLGVIFLNTGRISKAVEYFERAVRIDPINYNAQMMLGKAYAMAGDLENTRRRLLEAARLRPFDREPLDMLAQVLEQAGHKEESEAILGQAKQRSPSSNQ